MAAGTNSTAFFVHLEGLKLPDDTKQQIEKRIRALVLEEVAKIDLNGDLVVKNKIEQAEATRDLSSLMGAKFGNFFLTGGIVASFEPLVKEMPQS